MEQEIIKKDNELMLKPDYAAFIENCEKQIQELKKAQEKYKNLLIEKMGENNIKKIDTDSFSVTYIDSTTRESFDSKTFQKENKELYDEYITITEVKPQVRIKLKGE